jgi:hypothetical protein
VILETCNISSLSERERFYIKTLDTINLGYNTAVPTSRNTVNNVVRNNSEYKNAESAWEHFLTNRIKFKTSDNKSHFFRVKFDILKEDFIQKRIFYQQKYPNQTLVYNLKLKTIDKNLFEYVYTIDDLIFIPRTLHGLLLYRGKYQNQSGLKTGVMFSVKEQKYCLDRNNGIFYDTEDEAYNAYLKKRQEELIIYAEDNKHILDEDIVDLLRNITIEQIEQLIVIDPDDLKKYSH